ncbi:hypothetical protein [Streptomyces europaeiscabiei]|uniref:hypothetical protein n=1 Tax=Streptomyces europaeiscabiei TaxID=146819 RepID=UPI002E17F189
MQNHPTPESHAPAVRRALAEIEAAKLVVDHAVGECLDAIGDLIRVSGEPDAVYAWVLDTLGREHLAQFAARRRITVHQSRAVDEEHLDKTAVIWTADGGAMAIVPPGQPPATTLLQLREEIAEREADEQRALDFQASVAAGHIEGVEAWHARTSKAPR